MIDRRQATGRRAEGLARAHLEALGCRVRDANWRHSRGELDLVVEDGGTLVIVEVRSHRSRRFGTPEESITAAKQQRLQRLALAYVQAVDWLGPWRIDVVAVTFGARGGDEHVVHYRDAVVG